MRWWITPLGNAMDERRFFFFLLPGGVMLIRYGNHVGNGDCVSGSVQK